MTTGLLGIDWNILIPSVFTALTTLFGMYIAYQLKMIHTNVNSNWETAQQEMKELRATILKMTKDKAVADNKSDTIH